MSVPRRRRPLVTAGIIERHDNNILIVLPRSEADAPRLWRFPRGEATPEEPAEAAMRRVAFEQLGIQVETVVGQPPVVTDLDGCETEMRYFFCGLLHGEAQPFDYAEIRWVSKGHLREYEFDAVSRPVVEWLLES